MRTKRPKRLQANLMDALDRVCAQYLEQLDKARSNGLRTDLAMGACVQSMLRGIDRIAALPDERELTPDEVELFQSGLVQVYAAGCALLHELPLPGGGFSVVSFDMTNPQ